MAFHDFSDYRAVSRLKALAERPHDLTAPDGLSAERIAALRASSCGFDLLYATQRVNDEVLDALQALADEAGLVETFRAMKGGAVLNRIDGFDSENRQVLHTASRDVFAEPPAAPEASARARAELDKLRAFLKDLNRGRLVNAQGQPFTTMVQVGIGGSDLGPRALYLALKAHAVEGRSARFIANVDPDDAAEVLQGLDLSRTLVNIVSKSGTTLETLTNERLVCAALEKAGLDPARHLLAVTGEGSPMDDPSRYLASFYMFDSIGGRYSATSMVGAVTLGFALGMEAVLDILRGAHQMDLAAEEPDIRRNLPLLMALLGIWNHNFLGSRTVAILPYSQALSRFPAHLQQCDMESNGKSVTRKGEPVHWLTGPVIWGEPGTNGQHAFYQLIHQGTQQVPADFIGFIRPANELDAHHDLLTANMLAQTEALAFGKTADEVRADDVPDDLVAHKTFKGDHPTTTILGPRLTPSVLGQLVALYEHRVFVQGAVWGINSFDQWGVELGKVLARDLLQRLASGDASGLDASTAGLLNRLRG